MFKKISCADNPGIPNSIFPEIQKHSESSINWIKDYPTSNEKIIQNIGDSDCALVSWYTPIDREVIESCPNLKYIGMCCSLIDEHSANVDITAAREKGIVVKGVRDYGDEGVVEFILSELIRLLKGLGSYQWKDDQVELGGQKIGIIGMGATGRMLAEMALFMKMDVYYFNRSRKPDMEEKGCQYLPLNELLQKVDILSFHLPKNTSLLNANHFELLGSDKILINTTLGLCFELDDFKNWLEKDNNFAIMDGSGMGKYASILKDLPRMIYTEKTSGFTFEAKKRLGEKVLINIQEYLS